jgi:hypothetical protein
MVTQRRYLFPGTVGENLRFGPAQRGERSPLLSIEQLLAQVGLRDYLGRDVANLSGGEAQCVSVARTLGCSFTPNYTWVSPRPPWLHWWLASVLLARGRQIHLEGEILIAMVSGLVQIIAVGSVLVVPLRAPRWTSGLLLAGVIVAAGATSARALDIIWIPGLMAGVLLSGARPVNTAVYQFVALAMIFAASGLTSLVSTLLIRGRVFSSAEQLLLLPER